MLWLNKNHKLIMRDGKLIDCDHCPCGVSAFVSFDGIDFDHTMEYEGKYAAHHIITLTSLTDDFKFLKITSFSSNITEEVYNLSVKLQGQTIIADFWNYGSDNEYNSYGVNINLTVLYDGDEYYLDAMNPSLFAISETTEYASTNSTYYNGFWIWDNFDPDFE